MGSRMKKSAVVALGGITGALSLLCLFLSFLPASEYMMPMLAGMLLLPITVECGKRQGLLVYAAVALLALFLTPSLESRVLYATFFGYYPVLKAVFEEKLPRVPELLCKLLLFNAVICASYWLMLRFFGLDPAVFEIGGHDQVGQNRILTGEIFAHVFGVAQAEIAHGQFDILRFQRLGQPREERLFLIMQHADVIPIEQNVSHASMSPFLSSVCRR